MAVSTIKPLFVAPTTMTLPAQLNSLVDSGAVKLAYIDNGTDLLLDVAIEFQIVLGSPLVATADKRINIYAYGGTRNGVYSSNIDGTGGAYTIESPNDLALLGSRSVAIIGDGATAKGYIPSLAAYFNGVVPERWGLVIENRSGAALAAAGHSIKYGGFQAQGIS